MRQRDEFFPGFARALSTVADERGWPSFTLLASDPIGSSSFFAVWTAWRHALAMRSSRCTALGSKGTSRIPAAAAAASFRARSTR